MTDSLRSIGFKVPLWMLESIDEVKRQRKLVTRTEAARLIILNGLEKLGCDLTNHGDDAA